MGDSRLWLILAINIGGLIFVAGGGWFMLHQLRREVTSQWGRIDRMNTSLNQIVLAVALLAQSSNPHPNESALKICKDITKQNGH